MGESVVPVRGVHVDAPTDVTSRGRENAMTWQLRGLGKLLLSVLTAAARERGVKHFRAEVLNSNDAMRAQLRELDRDLEALAVDGGTATYDIALPEIAAHETVSGPLLHFLKTAARGIELRLRQLRDGR